MTGDEVVQLYFKDLESSVKKPNKQLIGFKRIALNKGEMKEVTFEVSRDQLMYWDEGIDDWNFEPGDFEFIAGASSEDVKQKKVMYIERGGSTDSNHKEK